MNEGQKTEWPDYGVAASECVPEVIYCPSPYEYNRFIEIGEVVGHAHTPTVKKCPYCGNKQKSISGLCIGCQAPW